MHHRQHLFLQKTRTSQILLDSFWSDIHLGLVPRVTLPTLTGVIIFLDRNQFSGRFAGILNTHIDWWVLEAAGLREGWLWQFVQLFSQTDSSPYSMSTHSQSSIYSHSISSFLTTSPPNAQDQQPTLYQSISILMAQTLVDDQVYAVSATEIFLHVFSPCAYQ